MSNKLYVGGLPYATTDDDLKELFAEHGTVQSAVVIKDRDSGQSKGFGFVEFESEEQAQTALSALDNQEVGGRRIKVSVARPKEER